MGSGRSEPHPTDLATDMARTAASLQASPEVSDTLQAIVTTARTTVPGAWWASVTVRAGRYGFETPAATHETAVKADALQYDHRRGPCVAAAVGSEWVRSGDVAHDARWSVWGSAAAALGVQSVLSVPLCARDTKLGALNLYSGSAGAFDTRDDIDLAVVYALHAAYALAAARLVTGLHSALETRHDIGMAQGILIERFGLTPDQAFNYLRRVSSHSNLQVAVIARELVETGRVPELE